MIFLCRKQHFTRADNETSMHVFCKQCNKTFLKCDLYAFQEIRGSIYLRQKTKRWVRAATIAKEREYKRRWRAKKKIVASTTGGAA